MPKTLSKEDILKLGQNITPEELEKIEQRAKKLKESRKKHNYGLATPMTRKRLVVSRRLAR